MKSIWQAMKHQLCRNCGHRHPLGAVCVGLTSSVVEQARKEIAADPSLTIKPTRVEDDEAASIIAEAFCDALVNAAIPLTPAQKQKAYREKHGEALREANKLRMRRKRKDVDLPYIRQR